MNKLKYLSTGLLFISLVSCAVENPITHEYKLAAFSDKKLTHRINQSSLYISLPEAVSGYQTNQMLYMDKFYELNAFAHNAWIGPPGDMLFPLILQSVQRSGIFTAIVSSVNAAEADYRLDTQLIELHQSFLTKPSSLHFTAKILLTQNATNKIMGSKLIKLSIPCNNDTPYGGVLAANKATELFTAEVSDLLIHSLKLKSTH